MAKSNPFSCSYPVLGQLLSFIPREIFKESVQQYQSNKWYKKLRSWDHFVFMFFATLTGSSTIREVIKNFTLMGDKLHHCGLSCIPKRSTISDANAHRQADMFGHLYLRLYDRYKTKLSDSYVSKWISGEVCPSQVEIFDSTTITLFKEVFKACGRLPQNGRRKGGLKAFTKITLSERVPNFICLKAAATNEKVFLGELDLPKGTIAVFDKGFQKFNQYLEWTMKGIFYVTRLNDNANFKIIKQFSIEHSAEYGVCQDSEIELTFKCSKTNEERTVTARMIAYQDPATGKRLVFVTNLTDVSALTVCLLYKDRWTIEPLFKQIKQNFELTYFLSDSEQGIKTQIWVALILNLIFTVIHKMVKEAEDFATMVKLAAKNTAAYVDFLSFLKTPHLAKQHADQCILENVQLNLFQQNKQATFYTPSSNTGHPYQSGP